MGGIDAKNRPDLRYNEDLYQQMRALLDGLPGLSEKKMMGGLCFLLDGNMIGAARRQKSGEAHFMFRVGKDNEEEALTRPGTRPMMHGGKKMGGFIYLDEDAASEEALRDLASLSASFVTTLPPK